MDTLTMRMNGEGDAVSPKTSSEVTQDASHIPETDVDSILDDIDNIMNGPSIVQDVASANNAKQIGDSRAKEVAAADVENAQEGGQSERQLLLADYEATTRDLQEKQIAAQMSSENANSTSLAVSESIADKTSIPPSHATSDCPSLPIISAQLDVLSEKPTKSDVLVSDTFSPSDETSSIIANSALMEPTTTSHPAPPHPTSSECPMETDGEHKTPLELGVKACDISSKIASQESNGFLMESEIPADQATGSIPSPPAADSIPSPPPPTQADTNSVEPSTVLTSLSTATEFIPSPRTPTEVDSDSQESLTARSHTPTATESIPSPHTPTEVDPDSVELLTAPTIDASKTLKQNLVTLTETSVNGHATETPSNVSSHISEDLPKPPLDTSKSKSLAKDADSTAESDSPVATSPTNLLAMSPGHRTDTCPENVSQTGKTTHGGSECGEDSPIVSDSCNTASEMATTTDGAKPQANPGPYDKGHGDLQAEVLPNNSETNSIAEIHNSLASDVKTNELSSDSPTEESLSTHGKSCEQTLECKLDKTLESMGSLDCTMEVSNSVDQCISSKTKTESISNMDMSADEPKESTANHPVDTLLEYPNSNRQLSLTNDEEEHVAKSENDAETDTNISDSDKSTFNIQILESTSIAGSSVFTKENASGEAQESDNNKMSGVSDSETPDIEIKSNDSGHLQSNSKSIDAIKNESVVCASMGSGDGRPELEEGFGEHTSCDNGLNGQDIDTGMVSLKAGKENGGVQSESCNGVDDSIILIDKDRENVSTERILHEEPSKQPSTAKADLKTSNTETDCSMKILGKADFDKVEIREVNGMNSSVTLTNEITDGETGEDKMIPETNRKRCFASEEDPVASATPKRTKFEANQTVGSGKVLEDNAMEVIDSDDDVILTEESHTPVDKSKTDALKKQSCDNLDNKEEVKVPKLEDDKEGKDRVAQETKSVNLKDTKTEPSSLEDKVSSPSINLASQVLQCFITARIKAFNKKQKQQQLDKLTKRITGMQSSTSLWKETAKHLERSVKEVTVINQNVDKRRGRLRNLSTQNVGVQVHIPVREDNKKRPPQKVDQVNPVSARAQASAVRAVLPQPGHQKLSPIAAPTHQQTAQATEVVNLIDLTDDEDVLHKKPKQSLPSSASSSSSPSASLNKSPVASGKTITNATAGGANGFIPLVPNRAVLSSNSGGSSQGTPQQAVGARSNVKLFSFPGQAGPDMSTAAQSNRQPSPGRPAQTSPGTKGITMHTLPPSFIIQQQKHPAPLPPAIETVLQNVRALNLPPKPTLMISRVSQGIVLSWNMPPLIGVEVITSYQLFAYQETDSTPKTSLWKKVGDVRALPLPMACTLTQFQEGNRYHFAVRAVDQYNRTGAFSDASSIFLGSTKK